MNFTSLDENHPRDVRSIPIMKPNLYLLLIPIVALVLPLNDVVKAEAVVSAERRGNVKIAAVQISGYDKGELPRPGYDVVAPLLPYIERAKRDGAELVVFPEYVLGHISVPGPETKRISATAAANGLYVIVGCWEVIDETNYANTALIFDRDGRIAGKYLKTHAAVDHFEGEPAWSQPPSGKDRD